MALKQPMREYLYFSRRDRVAVLVLTLLIVLAWLLPWLTGPGAMTAAAQDSTWISMLEKMDPGSDTESSLRNTKLPTDTRTFSGSEHNNAAGGKRFSFDPNTLGREGWQALGLREKTISTILNYRNKGGVFRTRDDLEKIYGLQPSLAEELKPFVRLPSEARADRPAAVYGGPRAVTGKQALSEPINLQAGTGDWYNGTGSGDMRPGNIDKQTRPGNGDRTHGRKGYEAVDINKADTTAFIALPLIGSRLAARIIQFREKLGGFHSISQVRETYGIADSVFRIILPYLKLESGVYHRIAVNQAGLDELKNHPYIRYELAKIIIGYRTQHGPFKSIEEIGNIAALSRSGFEKMQPYLEL